MTTLTMPDHRPGDTGLRGLLYRSSATQTRREFEATDPVSEFAARNAKLGLGGYLHMEDGTFYQYLEGEAAPLDIVWTAIKADPRHSAVTLLFDAPVAVRRFTDWAMGYSSDEAQSLFEWTVQSQQSLRASHPERVIIAFLEHAARRTAAEPS